MIEQSPEDQAVEIGVIVRLSCIVSGVPTPEIKFFRNGVEVVLDSRVVQIGQFLIITNALADDQGIYHCEATNEVDTVRSSNATLFVFGEYHNQL